MGKVKKESRGRQARQQSQAAPMHEFQMSTPITPDFRDFQQTWCMLWKFGIDPSLSPDKTFGQHLLKNPQIIDGILAKVSSSRIKNKLYHIFDYDKFTINLSNKSGK